MFWASTFTSKTLEREYQADLATEKIRLTRIVALLGIALTLSFVALDLWAIPSALTQVWTVRAVITAMFVLALLSTWHHAFQILYTSILLVTFAVAGVGINVMIYLAQHDEVAVDQYFGGLVIAITGLHALTYLKPCHSLLMSCALLLIYAAIAMLAHGYHSGPDGVILVANLFVGVSVTVIGIVAQSLRERYTRENYLLRHSLQRDVQIKDEERRRASYLADHDPLTGVANRLRFEREAGAMIQQAADSSQRVAIMFIDLDGFKPVNDSHGHAVGDRALKVIAGRLHDQLRADDICARVGGDEFVVAMAVPGGDDHAIKATAGRLGEAISTPIELRGSSLELSASIGVAVFPYDGTSLQRVLSAADERMYHVKRHGKSNIALTPACEDRQLAG
ncbi:MAG: diguanylate cyclase [Gammaproteobacteria bacterium]|nr:diguanylate cyclase [Gammaproteobacteria bacterium]